MPETERAFAVGFTPPDVTVIIPTYNRRELLEHAISTCFDGNDAVRVEVVVVDDGSTDDTRAFLASHPDPHVRPFYHEHTGPQQARNRGLDEALGRYVKFLDDDDWLAPGLIAEEVAMLDQHCADVSVARVMLHDGVHPLYEVGTCPHEDLLVNQLNGALPTLTLRHTARRLLAQKLKWDEKLLCGDDINFFWQVGAAATSWIRINSYSYMRHHEGPRVSKDAPEPSLAFLSETLRMVRQFEGQGLLHDSDRRRAACEGIWSRIRPCSTHDHPLLHEAWQLIEKLGQGGFVPPRPVRGMRWMDRLWGPIRTDLLFSAPRRLRRAIKNAHNGGLSTSGKLIS